VTYIARNIFYTALEASWDAVDASRVLNRIIRVSIVYWRVSIV
jgi:hypothetical protein